MFSVEQLEAGHKITDRLKVLNPVCVSFLSPIQWWQHFFNMFLQLLVRYKPKKRNICSKYRSPRYFDTFLLNTKEMFKRSCGARGTGTLRQRKVWKLNYAQLSVHIISRMASMVVPLSVRSSRARAPSVP
jgi:hypothetical protein